MSRFEREPEHVRQVARLATLLFDQLEPLHRLGPNDRDLLEAAERDGLSRKSLLFHEVYGREVRRA